MPGGPVGAVVAPCSCCCSMAGELLLLRDLLLLGDRSACSAETQGGAPSCWLGAAACAAKLLPSVSSVGDLHSCPVGPAWLLLVLLQLSAWDGLALTVPEP